MMYQTPPVLEEGHTVALLAPASPQLTGQDELIPKAIHVLESWGLQVEWIPAPSSPHFFWAGTDEERAALFLEAYSNPNIQAIFTTRGGYGSSRILPFLENQLSELPPKIVVGLSDITCLLLYLQQAQKHQVFHGPCVATEQFLTLPKAPQTQQALKEQLFLPTSPLQFDDLRMVHTGPLSTGPLTGGCLSLLTHSLGSVHEVQTKGHLLFIEDVNEKPYQIDRMLTQLRHAGKFEQVQGVVFGTMEGCLGKDDLLWKVLEAFFEKDPFPVLANLPCGHGPYSVTLPMGRQFELNHTTLRVV